jgi:hypothetical protein
MVTPGVKKWALDEATQRLGTSVWQHRQPKASGVPPSPALVEAATVLALLNLDCTGDKNHVVTGAAAKTVLIATNTLWLALAVGVGSRWLASYGGDKRQRCEALQRAVESLKKEGGPQWYAIHCDLFVCPVLKVRQMALSLALVGVEC